MKPSYIRDCFVSQKIRTPFEFNVPLLFSERLMATADYTFLLHN
jgi:hypothetical protein